MSQLSTLAEPCTVPVGLIDAFRRDGHVLVRDVASRNEVREHRGSIASAVEVFSRSAPSLAERDTYGKAFLQVMNLWRTDPDVARFVMSARFAGIAATLLGVERVRLYHDQALFKEPGGGHTPWHQDAVYWPIDGTKCVTMWMPLVDVTPEMGVMMFVSGTNDGPLGDAVISDDSQAYFDSFLTVEGRRTSTPVAMAAGDATFHGGWTLHKAGPNMTAMQRDVMTVIYFADGLTVQRPTNNAQRRDLKTWLPGLDVGDLAASDLNPLLPVPVA